MDEFGLTRVSYRLWSSHYPPLSVRLAYCFRSTPAYPVGKRVHPFIGIQVELRGLEPLTSTVRL
jgi:hypothetical protein